MSGSRDGNMMGGAQGPHASGQPDAQASPSEGPAEGSVIAGKYRIEKTLGAGGMGVVVAAFHMHLGQRVAIKFMRGAVALDGQAVGRFVREARAAAALSNEHVTRVLDVGTLENGAPYMVMEYLAGVDLAEVVQRDGPLGVPLAVDVVLQACEALAEAHARGIVHRDLKPANLFATTRPDGTRLVKVLDFGISKTNDLGLSQRAQSLTASGMVMGSPAYMSPEQVRSSKAVDARSDVWSLGVILYELLAGVSPFVGESLGETLARILGEDPPPIAQYRPDVPPELAAVIAQCLTRKLEARVQSVAELASRLLPFADAEAALSVKRILRLAGVSSSGAVAAPQVPSARPVAEQAVSSPTAQAWLRSGTSAGVPPSRLGLRLTLGATALLALAGAVTFYALRVQSARVTAASAPPVGPPSSLASPRGAVSELPVVPSGASSAPAEPVAVAAPTADANAPDASRASTPSIATSATRHGPVAPRPAAPPPRAHGGAADCDPPFTVDSAGYRVPKPECL
jgi:serine/threonine-protein kinase